MDNFYKAYLAYIHHLSYRDYLKTDSYEPDGLYQRLNH
jgi:hypothetical protein